MITGIIAILVLLNLGSLSYLWWQSNSSWKSGPENMFMPGPGQEEPPAFKLARLLDFSPEQYDSLRIFHRAHHEEAGAYRKEQRALHDELFQLLTDPERKAEAQRLTQAIGNRKAQQEAAIFHFFGQIRGLCTKPQQEEFDQIISDVAALFRRMPGERGPIPGSPPFPKPPGGP